MEHHHRSTFSQPNKKYKTRHRSNRQLDKANKGKIEATGKSNNPTNRGAVGAASKRDRINHNKQMMKNKRQKEMESRRLLATDVPRVIALVAMHESVDLVVVAKQLLEGGGFEGDLSHWFDNSALVPNRGPISVYLTRFRRHVTLVLCPRTVFGLLDCLKVCSTAVLVLGGNGGEVDDFGVSFFSILRAQGMPNIIGVMQTPSQQLTTETNSTKHHQQNATAERQRLNALKKEASKLLEFECPNTSPKCVLMANSADAMQCVRFIVDMGEKDVAWRSSRSHLVVETLSFTPQQTTTTSTSTTSTTQQQQTTTTSQDQSQQSQQQQQQGEVCTVVFRGVVRAIPLSAAQLLHVPGVGDFEIDQIAHLPSPYKSSHKQHNSSSMEAETNSLNKAIYIDKRSEHGEAETAAAENPPDLMANEQTWPTAEELGLDDTETAKHTSSAMATDNNQNENRNQNRKTKNSYKEFERAWMIDEHAGADDDDDDGSAESDGDDAMSHSSHNSGSDKPPVGSDNESDGFGDDTESERNMNAVQQNLHKQRLLETARSALKSEIEFPDEVDTPMNTPARLRFARYRGLRSLRTSPWDPKENLPLDYSRTTAFANPKKTLQRITKLAISRKTNNNSNNSDTTTTATTAEDDSNFPLAAAPGTFVEITLKNFPVAHRGLLEHMFATSVIVVCGLFQYENRLSVLNIRVQRHADYEEPIRSKQLLVVHAGFRTFCSKITFSEDNPKCDKHKMERFFQFQRSSVATCYGPVLFPPCPVLMFVPDATTLGPQLLSVLNNTAPFSTETANNTLSEPLVCSAMGGQFPRLCATGSLLGVDPDRVVLKKIVLSGFPLKLRKRHAVIRYMFFNPEDVRWFKPVDLWTKRGRKGTIREPVGTHGSFKAMFDGQVHSNDVVCMSLYKRAFPKYHPIIYTCIQAV